MATNHASVDGVSRKSELYRVYILLMGITGAGKSTLIMQATGNKDIPIGHDLRSQTKEVEEYILVMQDDDRQLYEVHLIDTPGFDDDDDFNSETDVLSKVAGWINSIFHKHEKISGVLYLHDISLGRIRGSGVRNLEMLPEFVGKERLKFCTLVTTHWGTLKDASKEVRNEEQLRTDGNYWEPLLRGYSCATMERFDNTPQSAWAIIRPHLKRNFVPAITTEMVDRHLPLEDTNAGKIVSKNLHQAYQESLRKISRSEKDSIGTLDEKYKRAKELLREKFDEQRSREYSEKARRMRRKHIATRCIRWVVRIGAMAGTVAATAVTAGLAGPSLVAIPMVEGWAQVSSAHDREQRQRLETEKNAPDGPAFRLFLRERWFSEEDLADFTGVDDEAEG